MKMDLEEFLELNVDELTAVNGGGSGTCSGSSWAGDCDYYSESTRGSGGSSSGSCSGSSSGVSAGTSGSCGGSSTVGTCSGSSSGASGTAGTCGGSTGTTTTGTTSSLPYQTADNPNDFHCDIIAYNEAIDHGITDPGTWNGNTDNIETIYENNYVGKGSDTAQSNTSGYVFYDCDSNGTYEHMEYYSAGAGNKYTCWTTDGITNPVPVTYDSTVDSNGHAKTGKATFVSLN